MTLRRHFLDLPTGQLHYVTAGDPHAPALLLLHQTPRSWREYASVIPLLAARWRVIAMDTPGFGDSDAAPTPPSIEAWAAAAATLLAHLAVAQVHVVGHHTGGVIAVALAAAAPARVQSLVLSSTPLTDPAFRAARRGAPAIDATGIAADGSHLLDLWQRRAAFYPPGRPDLLQAFVADALRGGDAEGGHGVVARYAMEDQLPPTTLPLCVFRADADPYAAPHAAHWTVRFPAAREVVFAGGMVPLPDQQPQAFANAVDQFLHSLPTP